MDSSRVFADGGPALDATFRFTREVGGERRITLVLESRGGRRGSSDSRNLDYLPALELLLTRLRDLDATLLLAAVETRRTQDLPLHARSITAGGLVLPLRLRDVDDIHALRIAVTEGNAISVSRRHSDFRRQLGLRASRACLRQRGIDEFAQAQIRMPNAYANGIVTEGQRHVGQRPGARGSNNTKRLRLEARISTFEFETPVLQRLLTFGTLELDGAALKTVGNAAGAPPQETWLPQAVVAPPPVSSSRGAGAAPAAVVTTIVAPDPALGRAGEEWVIHWERWRLTDAGRPDLAARISHASVEIGDGLGFDVSSFDVDGAERAIEVKTTRRSIQAPFIMTRREADVSSHMAERWWLYRVFEFGARPRLYTIQGSAFNGFTLEPTEYCARR
jgi:uncharacterized protein DUF3883